LSVKAALYIHCEPRIHQLKVQGKLDFAGVSEHHVSTDPGFKSYC